MTNKMRQALEYACEIGVLSVEQLDDADRHARWWRREDGSIYVTSRGMVDPRELGYRVTPIAIQWKEGSGWEVDESGDQRRDAPHYSPASRQGRKEREMNFRDTIDFRALHVDQLAYEFGTKLAITEDGGWFPVFAGTSLRGLEFEAILDCPGRGNIDLSLYSDGWAIRQDDGSYITEDGRIFFEDWMIEESIRDGDWDGLYEQWIAMFEEQAAERAIAEAAYE